MQINNESEYDASYRQAVLYRRVHVTLTETLIPHIVSRSDTSAECKRLLRVVERMPHECDQHAAVLISKLNMYKNGGKLPTLKPAQPTPAAPAKYTPMSSGGYPGLADAQTTYGSSAPGGYPSMGGMPSAVKTTGSGGYPTIGAGGSKGYPSFGAGSTSMPGAYQTSSQAYG